MAKATTTKSKKQVSSSKQKHSSGAFKEKLSDRRMLILVAGMGLISSGLLAIKSLLASY